MGYKYKLKESDEIDTISMDVPLFIRILEYSKEDAQTDMDLHHLAEKAIELSKQGVLSMDDYEMLVGGKEPNDIEEMSTSGGAGSYLTKYAFKLPKDYKKIKEGIGATLGPGPKASEEGVKDNYYVKKFAYKLVPKDKNGNYVQKGSGLEVKNF